MSLLFSRKKIDALDDFKKMILSKLNDSDLFKNQMFALSPRIVGDAIQEEIERIFLNDLPANIGKPIDEKFARRAMADLAFFDNEENYIMVDVKTHNVETKFNMPNLTSVERLSRFYTDDQNTFAVIIIEYEIIDNNLRVKNINFNPIEHFEWSCLTIGALGWGQIQIANSNIININNLKTRKDWMLELCDALDIFYPKEISKIKNRIEHFKGIREFWENK